MAEIDPALVTRSARAHAVAAARPPLRDGRADGGADASACGAGPEMIRYALSCDKGHSSKAGFPNSSAYDKQAKRGLVTCPHCGSAKVEKAIMAPRLAGTRKRGKAEAPDAAPAAAPGTAAGGDDVAAGAGIPRQAQGTARAPDARTPTMSARNFPKKRARCITARSSIARSTASPRPTTPRHWPRKASNFMPLPILPDDRN